MWHIITFLSLGLALAHGEGSQNLAAYADRRTDLVSLIVLDTFAIPTHTCSGFIIDSHTIITAARCIFEDDGYTLVPLANFRFRAGSPFLNSGGNVFTVDASRRFTAFLPSNMQRDIAYLETPFTILFGDSVKPAAIGGYEVAVGEVVDAVGWGYLTYPELSVAEFEIQHELPHLVVVNWEDCRSVYAANGFTLREDTICTEIENQGSITDPESLRQKCFGEAGSPVYHNGYVVGVRSFDVNCSAAIPSVNTRADYYAFRKVNLPMTIETTRITP